MLSPHNLLCFELQEEKKQSSNPMKPQPKAMPTSKHRDAPEGSPTTTRCGKELQPQLKVGNVPEPKGPPRKFVKKLGPKRLRPKEVLHPLSGGPPPDLARQAINALVDARMKWLGKQKNHLENWGLKWKGDLGDM